MPEREIAYTKSHRLHRCARRSGRTDHANTAMPGKLCQSAAVNGAPRMYQRMAIKSRVSGQRNDSPVERGIGNMSFLPNSFLKNFSQAYADTA